MSPVVKRAGALLGVRFHLMRYWYRRQRSSATCVWLPLALYILGSINPTGAFADGRMAVAYSDASTGTRDSAAVDVQDSSGTRRSGQSRLYVGGTASVGVFGKVSRVILQPLVAYNLTQKASIGAKLSYEYLSDRRATPPTKSHNYGGSLFSRYRIFSDAFAQIEVAIMSYDLGDARDNVPFLFLGGGYAKPIAPRTWFVAEVLVDLIRDDNSPYQEWEPRVSVGINVGL